MKKKKEFLLTVQVFYIQHCNQFQILSASHSCHSHTTSYHITHISSSWIHLSGGRGTSNVPLWLCLLLFWYFTIFDKCLNNVHLPWQLENKAIKHVLLPPVICRNFVLLLYGYLQQLLFDNMLTNNSTWHLWLR